MPLDSYTGGHGASKSSRDPKIVDYSPHENGQKCSKSRVLTVPLESCTRGHGPSGLLEKGGFQGLWKLLAKTYAFQGNAFERYFGLGGMDQRIWKGLLGRIARSNKATRFKAKVFTGLGKSFDSQQHH